MNGNAIKNALTRKIGPLPAWGWFIIGGAALVFYRMRHGAASSAQDQAQADAANPAYFGPYGQDNYPINGGQFTGGGSGGGDTSSSNPPPTINVIVPGPDKGKRTPKPKAQHGIIHGGTRGKGVNKPRSGGTIHGGRQARHGSGQSRNTHRSRSGGASVAPPKRTRKSR